ncbi:Ig-like domain-containing protein [uncultured Piscinibacter sp.]|uniref:Ig-like domain-containing protein n=1 Tax=uncultured Piscinibacter sp. TaxID=1131835 RepID=UPI00262FA664|nr:Ig-like domain-containing protein [uncultured Piscinibacter sp.]
MPVIARSPEGKVASLWGTALIRGADGKLRQLKVGDLVRQGDQLLTTQDGIVQIAHGDAPVARTADAQVPNDDEVDRAISALNAGDRHAAPAAGLAGGEGGSLEAALRVDRISEGVAAAEIPRRTADAELRVAVVAGGATVAPAGAAGGQPAPDAPSSTISAAEEEGPTNLGLTAPGGAAAGGTIRVEQVPAVGEIRKADGTLVTAGTVLNPADLPGLVYVPPADYDGRAPAGDFVYSLTVDGQTLSGGTSVTLTAVNDAPVAAASISLGAEDGALPVSLSGSDVDGHIVRVTVTALPAGGTLWLADGVTPVTVGQTLPPDQAASLLYRPGAEFHGTQTLSYTVTDDGGATSPPATVSLIILAVNDLPVAAAGSGGRGHEDMPVAVRLGGTDIDGTVTTVTVTDLPANGTLTLADGTTPVMAGMALTPAQAANLVFMPDPDFHGSVGIGFTVTDDEGGTSTPVTALVTVQAVNDAPLTQPDSATLAEDGIATGNVLGNDSDIDGPSLAVASFRFGGITHPAGSTAVVGGVGTLSMSVDGDWTYAPAPNFNGSVPAIEVTVSDGSLSTTSTLSLTVTPINDAPQAQADFASTPINTPAMIDVLANDSDVEGEALTVTAASVADPSQGNVVVNADGTLGFTPGADFSGTATISYTVRDASGATSAATVNVAVGANGAPDGADVVRTLAEDGGYTLQAADFGFSDADTGQTLANVRINSLPAAGTLLLNGAPLLPGTVVSAAQIDAGTLAFVPAGDGNGAPYASFTFSVQDSAGAFDATPNIFRFDVMPVNDAPIASSSTIAVAEESADTPLGLTAPTDVDGDALTITVTGLPSLGTVTLADGTAVANSQVLTAAQLAGLQFDAPADLLAATSTSFSYSVSDGTVTVNAGTTINLTPVNDAPAVSSSTITVAEESADTPLGLAAPTDVDGDALTITVTGLPSLGTVTLADGTAVANSQVLTAAQLAGLQFDAPADLLAATSTSFSYSVSDGTVTVNAGTTINLTPVNDAPIASSSAITVAEDAPVVAGALVAADSDAGATLSFALNGPAPAGLTFDAGGVFSFDPANAAYQSLGVGQSTVLTVPYTVTDDQGAVATANLVITVTGTNDLPVAQAAAFAVAEDAVVVTGSVTASDVDAASSFTFALNGAAPAGLSFDSDGSYSFDPAHAAYQALADGQTQLITVPYTVTDNAGATSTANLVITVIGTGDAPTIDGTLTGTVREDTTLTATGTLTVSDPDAGQSLFTAQSNVPGTFGSFSVSAAGVWTYTLANGSPNVQALPAGSAVTENFVVVSADGTPRTVVVTVNGINDAPVAQAASLSVAEGAGTVNGSVLATDVDSGSLLDFALTGLAPPGLSFNSDGSYSFDAADPAYQALGAGQTQLITIPFTVTDETGATSAASLVISVTGTNAPPTATGGSIAGLEDSALAIGWSAFGVSDDDSTALSIQLTSLPADGTLQYFDGSAWVSVAANQAVSRADIDAGRLRFVPDANESGDGSFAAGGVGNLNQDYARIGFRPYDGHSFGATATLAIDIQPVADAPTLTLNPVPPSLGLTLQFYDNVPTVSPSSAGNTATVETALQGLAATSTLQTTNLAVASVGVDDAYRASGYVYLQAGNTYTLSGYRDDTLLAKIGGTTVYDRGFNNYGNFSASGFTPTVSGYYSVEVVMYNGDGSGALDVNLAVNGGTPIDLSTANFSLYPDAASLTATGTAVGSFVAIGDGGYFPQRLSGPEDGYIRLGTLGVSAIDTDGSETLAVSVSGLQVGGTLTDGTHTFTATAGGTSVGLAGWNLAGLQYRAPADFNGSTSLTISATASEPNGNSATTTLTLPIDVLAVNDAPVGVADTATVGEGSSGMLASVLANDTDVETAATGVAEFGASAGGSAVAANGVNTITTALGGTVVMNADGSYRYFAPAASHGSAPVVDSFAYRPTDGSTTGAWTTVSITLTDSTPAAANDTGTVAWSGSVSGNLLTNDAAIDAAKSLVDVNGVAVPASGTTTVTLAHGTLLVAADGSFTYTSNQTASGTAGGSSEATWRSSVGGLWGFSDANWSSGGNLNLTALAAQPDLVNYQGGSKPGIQVGNSGIEFSENLIVQLPESSTQATVSLSQLNASQPTATWFAYDGGGNLVGSGTFAPGPSNGSTSAQTITTASPFEYLRFTNTLPGGQGFMVSTVQYNKLASTHVDTVSYTMQDGDGDTSVALLTLTPGSASSFSTSLPAGSAGDDHLTGTSVADTLSGGDGHDQLRGLAGADTLGGGNGNDLLFGGAGNDALAGGAGNDSLIGGAGNDSLAGGGGVDVFQWQLADRGTAGAPAVDTITDFDPSAVSAGGDVIDLRDLLQGETLGGDVGNLANYLHFSSSGGTTTIQISSSGAFTGGNYGSATDQTIVLQNVNLFSGGLTTDQQVIQDLLNKSKLVVDNG